MVTSELIKILQESMEKHGDREIVTDIDREWLDSIWGNGNTLYIESFNEARKEI